MKQAGVFFVDRVTKNTVRYRSNDTDPITDQIYIEKAALGMKQDDTDAPKSIKITLEFGEYSLDDLK